jgi:hypothetical protein
LTLPVPVGDVRQFWASLLNVIYPKNGASGLPDGVVTAEDSVSEQLGHTATTQEQHYGSWMENSLERKYESFHVRLGDRNNQPEQAVKPVFRISGNADLERALKTLRGHGATFLNEAQERMVWLAANYHRKHCQASVPCGSGKSMTWTLSTYAAFLCGEVKAMSIVIVPYKFLLHYHVSTIEDMYGHLGDGSTVRSVLPAPIPCARAYLDSGVTMVRNFAE